VSVNGCMPVHTHNSRERRFWYHEAILPLYITKIAAFHA
jgi:hypothetical protein